MVRGRGDDSAPRLARVRKERNDRTGMLLTYSKRFYHLGVSVLKMSLYRDLLKDDPGARGYVSFPSGLGDEYFQELTAERREPVKRHGFTVYRWIKDDRQDNEALDTMIIATGAAIKFGLYGISDLGWDRVKAARMMAPTAAPTQPPTSPASPASPNVVAEEVDNKNTPPPADDWFTQEAERILARDPDLRNQTWLDPRGLRRGSFWDRGD
jgi:phage terminase large subunit GpA-like protein